MNIISPRCVWFLMVYTHTNTFTPTMYKYLRLICVCLFIFMLTSYTHRHYTKWNWVWDLYFSNVRVCVCICVCLCFLHAYSEIPKCQRILLRFSMREKKILTWNGDYSFDEYVALHRKKKNGVCLEMNWTNDISVRLSRSGKHNWSLTTEKW